MDWPFIVAVAIAVPIILFPAAFIWYLNLGGLVRVIRAIRARELGATAPVPSASAPCRSRCLAMVSFRLH